MSKKKIFYNYEGKKFPLTMGSKGSSGIDLCSQKSYRIGKGMSKLIETGLRVAIPEGYEIQIRPRSGLALKHGITVLNTPGTVDSDYRGEVGVILINHSTKPFYVTPGDRIAQMVVMKVETADFDFVESETLEESDRGEGGFGSTGVQVEKSDSKGKVVEVAKKSKKKEKPQDDFVGEKDIPKEEAVKPKVKEKATKVEREVSKERTDNIAESTDGVAMMAENPRKETETE